MKTNYFSNDFFTKLPDDPLLGISAFCAEFKKFNIEAKSRAEYLADYLTALAAFQAYSTTNNYPLNPAVPNASASPGENMNSIVQFFSGHEAAINQMLNTVYLQRETKKYEAKFQSESAYVFTDDEYIQLQKLINEMREIISGSDVINAKHKQRLLERLERLQRELHKTTSDLDRFWGFVGEAGIVIGKFGTDIKPLVDRIRELTNIVWRVVALKELLLDKSNPIMLPDQINSSDSTVST